MKSIPSLGRKSERSVLSAAGLLALTIGAALLLTGCGRGGGRGADAGSGASAWAPEEKPTVPVETLTITRGKLIGTIEASGIISGINEAYVTSETQGVIRQVLFNLGDAVQRGQVLLRVDDAIPRINMEQARQAYETAQIELASTQKLFEAGNVSRARLIQVQSNVSGAKAAYERALKEYLDCSLKAPIGGYVAEKDAAAAVGNYLNSGQTVSRIVDISSLELKIGVGEGEVGLIEPGAPAEVTIPNSPDPIQQAEVNAVAAGADPATGSYTVVIQWPNTEAESIKSGMTATVSVETVNEPEALIVPSSAVLRREDRSVVLIARDGQAVSREVHVGRTLGSRTEVLYGLEEGELLIITRLSTLVAQDPVKPEVIGESGSWL